jgi:hypothetical protein
VELSAWCLVDAITDVPGDHELWPVVSRKAFDILWANYVAPLPLDPDPTEAIVGWSEMSSEDQKTLKAAVLKQMRKYQREGLPPVPVELRVKELEYA